MAKQCAFETEAKGRCKYNVFSGDYCKIHQKYQRDPKKRPKKPNQVSKKQRERMSKYRPIRKKFLEDNPVCMVKREGCFGDSTNVHHGRGKVGDMLYDARYFIACCSGPCHRWCEEHPEEAKALGFSFSRLSKEIINAED